MGDILNINGVDICANILDLDTVLQANIVNVNSVTVDCGYSGGSWECSATTLNSCSGKTFVGAYNEQTMSDHFSDITANQGLLTTDYYYIDYTASTTSTSCLVYSGLTRYLLGWSIDINPPGNALYSWPGVGGGIIHDGWSTFLIALNSTPFLSVPPNLTAAQLASHLAGLTPTPTYSPIFKDCVCTYDCECIPISGSSGAYSSMTQCLQDDDTCCTECEAKSAISLAMHDSDCEPACDGTCYPYWTEYPLGVPCPMAVGDMLYIDEFCTPAPRGFYSPNNCDSACPYCYEIGVVPGEIIAVTTCEECSTVVLFADPFGDPCPSWMECDDIDCNTCLLNNPFFPHTDAPGTPPILQVGHHLWKTNPDDDCFCWPDAALNLPTGLYRWFDSTTSDYWCIELGELDCEIIKKTWCEEPLPDGDGGDSDDEDKDWIVDDETGYRYYDEDGYRYYDTDGDGDADYSEPLE